MRHNENSIEQSSYLHNPHCETSSTIAEELSQENEAVKKQSKLRSVFSDRSMRSFKNMMSSHHLSTLANDIKIRTYQVDEKKLYSHRCCDEESTLECLQRCFGPFIRNFIRGGMIKFLLGLMKARTLPKIIKAFQYDIPRFGATLGASSALFHLLLCTMRRIGKRKVKKWMLNMSD